MIEANYSPELSCNKVNFSGLEPKVWPHQWHPTSEFPTPQSVPNDEFGSVVDGALSFEQARKSYRLGSPILPVAPFREHISDTIFGRQNIILASPTGTGKSSQTGLYILEDGSDYGIERVFISSPRILAARELMGWAKHGLGFEYEQLAGYLTGTASDSDTTANTRLFYVTEQLLAKMANRGEVGNHDVLINDEAHERGVATIVLQGLARELMQDHPDMKLVISSATIDTAKNARHFTDTHTGAPAAIIELRGVTHPIENIHSDRKVAHIAKDFMKDHNVLVFEPGETRQKSTQAQMSDRKNGHTVHVLNATLSPSEQVKALNPADKNHIVGNKIAETSITPDNKDVVVDSGLSNIGKYEQGVKVLKTIHSSKATMMQRRGRIGRTAPGTYVVAVPENAPPIAYEDREAYDPSPIETSSVASYIAELLVKGRRIEDMDLLERPTNENLAHDHKLLRRLGATAIVDGEVGLTDIGRAMVDLPLDMTYARMLVEARTIDAIYDVDKNMVRTQVAAATAVRQVAGILNAWNFSRKRYRQSHGQEEELSHEHTSDMLFELDVFIKMLGKRQSFMDSGMVDWQEKFEMHLRSKDVFVNRFHKAFLTYEEVCRREGIDMANIRPPLAVEKNAIIGCQIAGTEELFTQKSKYIHHDIRGGTRRLGKRSTIDQTNAQLVVGSAFDLVGMREYGHYKRSYIVGASVVRQNMLEQHASHRIARKHLGYAVTPDGDFVERQTLYFDTTLAFGELLARPQATIEAREFIIRSMMKGFAHSSGKKSKLIAYDSGTEKAARARAEWQRAQGLEHKTDIGLGTNGRYEKLIAKAVRDSIEKIPLEVMDPSVIDQVIPEVDFVSLLRPSQRHRTNDIEHNAPVKVAVLMKDETVTNLPITYKHNIAYISVPLELQYLISPQDIVHISDHHPVKIKVGAKDFLPADVVFKQIENQRKSTQEKRAKRLLRRAVIDTEQTINPEAQKRVNERLAIGKRHTSGGKLWISTVQKLERKRYVSQTKKQRGKHRKSRLGDTNND